VNARFSLVALAAASLALAAAADDWPQWRGAARDGVWKETGLVERFAGPELAAKWRAPVGAGYSGPTVAAGKVYLTDRILQPRPQERVLCFDSATGRQVWAHSYDCVYQGIGYQAGPRASVTIDQGRAYSLGAMGHLFCLDAANGARLWGKNLAVDYNVRMPVWGIAAAPLIVGERLILQVGGADGACVVALDKKTGNELWRSLDDQASYSPPVLVTQAGKPVVVVWTGDGVHGLDPATGKPYWSEPFPSRQVVIAIATPVIEGDRLFLTSFYQGSMMLRLKQDTIGVEKLWQRRGQSERSTDALHSIISTPLMQGGYIYGVDSYGELRCLDAKSGDRLWENQTATPRARWSTIHFVPNGDRVWMFNERGQLLITKLSPRGYEEVSRAQLLAPTTAQLNERGGVCWSHPAFAEKSVFARNDQELVCASLAR
jgi:outer membrane protein assembly factor BamB